MWQGDVSFATFSKVRGHTALFIGHPSCGMSPIIWQTKRPLATKSDYWYNIENEKSKGGAICVQTIKKQKRIRNISCHA